MTKKSRIWIFLRMRGLPAMVCCSAAMIILMCSLVAFMFGFDSKFKQPIEWDAILTLAVGMTLIFSVFILVFYGKYIFDIVINKPVWIEGKVIEKSDIREYIIRTLRTRKIGEKILIEDSEGKTVKIDLLDNVLDEINKNTSFKKRVQYKKRYHYLPVSKFVIDIEFIPVIREDHYKMMRNKKYRREIKTWIEAPEYR